MEKVGKGKVTANTTRKSLLIEPTLLIANDHNNIRASIPCQETHLSISLGKRKNGGSSAAVIFISVAKQVRKIDKINHTN